MRCGSVEKVGRGNLLFSQTQRFRTQQRTDSEIVRLQSIQQWPNSRHKRCLSRFSVIENNPNTLFKRQSDCLGFAGVHDQS